MATITRRVSVWYDDQQGREDAGWVARCTEYDEDGAPILGRIAMDWPCDATDRADVASAVTEAARHWRVPAADVNVDD